MAVTIPSTGGAGHNPVTLSVAADVLLALAGQQVGLDDQAANCVLAGPATGAAAAPTFRALVAADIPSLSAYFVKATDTLDAIAEGTTNKHLTATLKTYYSAAYSHKLVEDNVTGLVKCNGAGTYAGVADSSANWNTAYGWGNHASAGYASAASVVPYTGATADVDLGSRSLTAYTLNVINDVAGNSCSFTSTSPGSEGPSFQFYHDSPSPAANDCPGAVVIAGNSSTGAARVYADISGLIQDATNGAEYGQLWFSVLSAGSVVTPLKVLSTGIVVTGLTLPHSANPSVTAVGQMALDTTDNTLVVHDGTSDKVYAHPVQVLNFCIAKDAAAGWDNQTIPLSACSKDMAITILQVDLTAVGTGTPTLACNLEERAWASYNSAGTAVTAAAMTATGAGLSQTSFSNAGIAARAGLFLTTGASAESGTVNFLMGTIYFTRDRE